MTHQVLREQLIYKTNDKQGATKLLKLFIKYLHVLVVTVENGEKHSI